MKARTAKKLVGQYLTGGYAVRPRRPGSNVMTVPKRLRIRVFAAALATVLRRGPKWIAPEFRAAYFGARLLR